MHDDHGAFLGALHARRKLRLTFLSKEDGGRLERTCAPMDFGPSRRAKDGADRYHLWDYDSDTEAHPLSVIVSQVVRMEPLDEAFDPADFVTWDLIRSPWSLPRDWGRLS